jgi:hypothetical protein
MPAAPAHVVKVCCPGKHPLQPWRAAPGTWCDACSSRVATNEWVMACCQCNWCACEECLPPEECEHKEREGLLLWLAKTVAQEFRELVADVEKPLAACTTVDLKSQSGGQHKGGVRETDEEIIIVQDPRMNRRENPKNRTEETPEELEDCNVGEKHMAPEAEDLLDLGQKDLLDLAAEPVVQKAPAAVLASGAQQDVVVGLL